MIYILVNDKKIVGTSASYPFINPGYEQVGEILNEETGEPVKFDSCQTRNDWDSFTCVEAIAAELTKLTKKVYLPVDRGLHVSPQYDIIEAMKIGDKVSKSFNGDYYPQGEIVSITKKWMITTSSGAKFRRSGNSARWQLTGGTWGLVPAHRTDQNHSF